MNAILKNLIHLQQLVLQFENAELAPNLRKQIDGLRAMLPEEVLRRFDHVAEHRRISVAALTASGACGICHMKLPPADILQVRRSTHSLPICPLCGGFIYDSTVIVEPTHDKVEVAT